MANVYIKCNSALTDETGLAIPAGSVMDMDTSGLNGVRSRSGLANAAIRVWASQADKVAGKEPVMPLDANGLVLNGVDITFSSADMDSGTNGTGITEVMMTTYVIAALAAALGLVVGDFVTVEF